MGRETRGAAKATEVAPPPPPPAVKRKRRGSPSPARTPTVKVTIPSKALPATDESTLELEANQNGNVDDPQDNGDEHGTKRARISLKIKKPEQGPVEEIQVDQPEVPVAVPAMGEMDTEVPREPIADRALSKEVRDALAKVIVAMAANLPPPLNRILGLWLPPDFAQKQENTLGYVLRQDTLTWETLVDILHIFSKNLLVPCNYPNPMPSITQFHLPIPTLPSHYPPHPIYSFCAGLHSVMAQIAPSDIATGTSAERWGLVQKVPHGPSGSAGDHGDWFTAGADPREVGGLLEKLKKVQGETPVEGTLLEQLSTAGDRFGYANAMAVQSATGSSKPVVRTLNDSVIKKASMKARLWKETRTTRSGEFGNGSKSVRIPPTTDFSFTPTFGAYYDTNHYFGGYYDTMDAMHERARRSAWVRHARNPIHIEKGYQGCLESAEGKKDKGKSKETAEDILGDNAKLIDELQYWQEIRVQRGDASWSCEREQLAAEELLASLTRLASMSKPSDFTTETSEKAGLAHRLAQRVLQTNGPSIRGTLDPRRPRAIHDNLTVRGKSPAAQPMSGTSGVTVPGSSSYPARQSTMYQPPRQQPSYPSPTPYRPPTPNFAYTSPFASQNRTPNGTAPSPRTQPPANYRPPIVGPSGLRQSFGPGAAPPSPLNQAASRTGSQRI